MANFVMSLISRITEMEAELREFATAAQISRRLRRLEIAGDELQKAWDTYQGRQWRGNAIGDLLNAVTRFIHSWLSAKKAKRELEGSNESA